MSSHRTLILLLCFCSIPGAMLCMSGSGRDARITEAFQARAARARERARQAQEQARAQQEVARILEEAQARERAQLEAARAQEEAAKEARAAERARQESILREINARKAEEKKARDAEEKAAQEAHEREAKETKARMQQESKAAEAQREAEARAQFEAETRIAVDFLRKLLDERSIPRGRTMSPELFNMLVHQIQRDPNVIRVLASDTIPENNQLRVRLFNVLDIAQRLELCTLLMSPIMEAAGTQILVKMLETIKRSDLRAIAQNQELRKTFNSTIFTLAMLKGKENEEIKKIVADKVFSSLLETINNVLQRPLESEKTLQNEFAALGRDVLHRGLLLVPFDNLTKEQREVLDESLKTIFRENPAGLGNFIATFKDVMGEAHVPVPEQAGRLVELIRIPGAMASLALTDWPLIIEPLLQAVGRSTIYDREILNWATNFSTQFANLATQATFLPSAFLNRTGNMILGMLDHLAENKVPEAYQLHIDLRDALKIIRGRLERQAAMGGELKQLGDFENSLSKQIAALPTGIVARIGRVGLVDAFNRWLQNGDDFELLGIRRVKRTLHDGTEYDAWNESSTREIYYNLYRAFPKERERLLDALLRVYHTLYRSYEPNFDDPAMVEAFMPYMVLNRDSAAYQNLNKPHVAEILLNTLRSRYVIERLRQTGDYDSLLTPLRIISYRMEDQVLPKEIIKQIVQILMEEIRLALKGRVYENLWRAQQKLDISRWPDLKGHLEKMLGYGLRDGQKVLDLIAKEEKAQAEQPR